MTRSIAVIALIFVSLLQGLAQTPQAASTAQSAEESGAPAVDTGTVMRITVNLVQVDAVVTDSRGNPVTTLKGHDFEVLQDGKAQAISNFSYVPNEAARSKDATRRVIYEGQPTNDLKREDIGRTIAIVVDDLGLSFESMARVRQALDKFIDDQVQPGDLVALISTGKGVGAFQQFTTDKQALHVAAANIRFNFMNRVGIFGMPTGVFSSTERRLSTPQTFEDLNDIQRDQFLTGTLGALQWVIRGLREMPGRKSIVLFSEDLRMFSGNGQSSAITGMVRRIVDSANRSSVVFYVIDPRGLVVLGPDAADASPPDLNASTTAFWDSQEGMGVLAGGTGGLLLINSNDINDELRQMMRDQEGYYLIGYKPAATTFDVQRIGPQFHNIRVRLRPGLQGLKIRSRTGFYGVTDEEVRSRAKSREQLLAAALFSPFVAKDIRLRLTPLFANSEKIGPFVQTLLHVDARDLKFSEIAGKYKSGIEVVMATFSADGIPVDLTQRTLTLDLDEEDYRACLERGALFTLAHKVRKGGGYQFRAVIRDVTTNKLGSVNQFIEVPDWKKKHLALSGIVLHEVHPDAPAGKPAGDLAIPMDGWSSRVFRPGTELAYDYEVLNMRREPTSKKPHLQAQIRLLKEGKELFLGKSASVNTLEGAPDKYFAAQGAFRLAKNMAPGSYVLQVMVTDELAPEKYKRALQWVDFEVK